MPENTPHHPKLLDLLRDKVRVKHYSPSRPEGTYMCTGMPEERGALRLLAVRDTTYLKSSQ